MHFSSIEAILYDIEYHSDLKHKYQLLLKSTNHCRDQSLSLVKKNGRKYYILIDNNSNTKRSYLGVKKDGQSLVNSISKRKYLIEALKRIESNLNMLNLIAREYRAIDPNDIRDDLPEAYKDFGNDIYALAGVANTEGSENQYKNEDFYRSGLRHFTTDGHQVRSKSETLLTYIFNKLGLTYSYEEPLTLGDFTARPDFRIYSPGGKKSIYLEHFGMMSDPAYRHRAGQKINSYITAGFIPGIDIIFTFDSYDGNFNSYNIESTLKAWIDAPYSVKP